MVSVIAKSVSLTTGTVAKGARFSSICSALRPVHRQAERHSFTHHEFFFPSIVLGILFPPTTILCGRDRCSERRDPYSPYLPEHPHYRHNEIQASFITITMSSKGQWRPPSSPQYPVMERYSIQEEIGQGAYGKVHRAIHLPTGNDVAIKRVAPFDRKITCLRTLREIRLLRQFDHENIISLREIINPIGTWSNSEIDLVLEFMPVDLSTVIRTQELSDKHCEFFTYQLLRGLKFVHSAGVIHRDIKPANLLVNDHCDLKICDFGLARYDVNTEEAAELMTEYVATRWYRAPEIMHSFSQYTQAIDIWATGCVLAEMLGGTPLFRGRDYHNQLMLILQTLGSITEEDYLTIRSARARDYIRSLPKQPGIPWRTKFPKATECALELLQSTLMFDPDKRPTANEALNHLYLIEYHDPADEPLSERFPNDILWFDKVGGRPNHDDARSKFMLFYYADFTRLMQVPGLLRAEVAEWKAPSVNAARSLMAPQ